MKMKRSFISLISALAVSFTPPIANTRYSQVADKEILHDNYVIGNSDEIVLGYMADRGNSVGGPVFIAIYDLDRSSGTLVLKDSLSTVQLKPGLYNAINGLSRGSLFDIGTSDFNQDGMDEIVVSAFTPYPDGDDFGWRLWQGILITIFFPTLQCLTR